MPLQQLPILREDQRLNLVQATAQDFLDVFARALGDCAEHSGIEILAKYKYSKDYSTWAIGISNTPDSIDVVGDGLELLINPVPSDIGSDLFQYNKRWRILVKDHSKSQNKIHLATEIVRTYLFPHIDCKPYERDEELGIQQAVWRIDRVEVPKIRNGKRSIF